MREHCEADSYEQNDRLDQAQMIELTPSPLALTLCDEDWFNFDAQSGISSV